MTTKESTVADEQTQADGTKPKVAVASADDTWTGYCTSPLCGVAGGAPFETSGWPTKKAATERILQHQAEHETGVVMQPLEEFRAERGLGVDGDGVVFQLPEGATTVG